MKKFIYTTLLISLFISCGQETTGPESFIEAYNKKYVELYYASSKAEWKTNTQIIPGDTVNAYQARRANEAFSAFTGSIENIESLVIS